MLSYFLPKLSFCQSQSKPHIRTRLISIESQPKKIVVVVVVVFIVVVVPVVVIAFADADPGNLPLKIGLNQVINR